MPFVGGSGPPDEAFYNSHSSNNNYSSFGTSSSSSYQSDKYSNKSYDEVNKKFQDIYEGMDIGSENPTKTRKQQAIHAVESAWAKEKEEEAWKEIKQQHKLSEIRGLVKEQWRVSKPDLAK